MPLSKRRQFEIIHGYVAGAVTDYERLTREEFDPHLWQIFDWLRRGDQPAAGAADDDYRKEVLREMGPLFVDERQARLIRDLEACLLYDTNLPTLEDIARDLRPVSWLWQGWLPVGMITILAARPGSGKSLVALDIANRAIGGDVWPDGAPVVGHGAVIWVEGENNPTTLNERAQAWAMARDRIFPLLPTEKDPIIDLSDPTAIIEDSVPPETWQERLVSMTRRVFPRLIVIDSLGSITRRSENAVEEVRDIMAFLNGLAVNYEVPILLIHHLRKLGQQLSLLGDGDMDMDMVRGSGHLAAMARVIWGLSAVQTGPEPDANGPRKLQVIKTNISAAPAPLGLTLEPIVAGDPTSGVRIEWSANAPKRYQAPTERDTAEEWLLSYLEAAGEPVSPKDAVAAARDAGFSRATIYRAYDELLNTGAIVNTTGRKSPSNCWRLPSQTEDDAP
jgi:hypothetical protein